MTIVPGNCPRCGGYKRGIDGRCAHCNARLPDNEPAPRVLDLMAALKDALKQNPATARTVTGRGADAEESPASVPNVDPAREGSKP